MSERRWEVTVRYDGEEILNIGNDLSGLPEFSEAQEEAIRDAGTHLLAFIGTGEIPECFICNGEYNGCPICDPAEPITKEDGHDVG